MTVGTLRPPGEGEEGFGWGICRGLRHPVCVWWIFKLMCVLTKTKNQYRQKNSVWPSTALPPSSPEDSLQHNISTSRCICRVLTCCFEPRKSILLATNKNSVENLLWHKSWSTVYYSGFVSFLSTFYVLSMYFDGGFCLFFTRLHGLVMSAEPDYQK